MLTKLNAWLTDARRQKLHAALGSLAALLVAAGYVNDSQSTALLGLAGSILILAQGALGLALLRPSQLSEWFDTAGRGIVYGAAAAVGAVGVAFGWWVDADAARLLGLFAMGLTALSSFLAVVNVQTVKAG